MPVQGLHGEPDKNLRCPSRCWGSSRHSWGPPWRLLPVAARASGPCRPRPPLRRPQSGPAPMILDVRCVGNPDGPCVEIHRVDRGATVRVSGRNLGRAAQLVFYGSKGERDDALAPVSGATPGTATASVPAAARSGPVAVLDASGRRSLRWTGLVLDDPLKDFGTYQPLGAPSPVRVAVRSRGGSTTAAHRKPSSPTTSSATPRWTCASTWCGPPTGRSCRAGIVRRALRGPRTG